jgi:hypothetical protein
VRVGEGGRWDLCRERWSAQEAAVIECECAPEVRSWGVGGSPMQPGRVSCPPRVYQCECETAPGESYLADYAGAGAEECHSSARACVTVSVSLHWVCGACTDSDLDLDLDSDCVHSLLAGISSHSHYERVCEWPCERVCE